MRLAASIGQPRIRSTAGRLTCLILLATQALAIQAACAGSYKPREVCLVIEATQSLNLYDGQAHALNLLIYPLTGPAAFNEASVDALVSGRGIEGAAGPAISVMMSPGEVREVREVFPAGTTTVGLVADYYQAGMESPGTRRLLVTGKCSMFGSEKIMLTARDLRVD